MNTVLTIVSILAMAAYLLVDRHLPMLVAARNANRPLLRMPRLFADRPRTDP